MLSTEASKLWKLARSGQPIDADRLAAAVVEQVDSPENDFRTHLLIRDSLDALRKHWGQLRMERWLGGQPAAERLRALWNDSLGPPGFPTLLARIIDATDPEAILSFFRELGTRLEQPTRLDVGGSTSLMLGGLLSRHTDDIDVVDELPPELRSQHDLLADLAASYGLLLAQCQSRDLPAGWRDRLHSLGQFGKLDVFLVDAYDMLISKLTSARRKDRDDLRAVAKKINKETLLEGLTTSATALMAEPRLAENARTNWYVVFGENLPVKLTT